jgi:Fe-S-cluster containining protein
LINLSKKEYNLGIYQAKFQGDNLYLLDQKADGSCIYLVNKLCSIHTWRPKVCQSFFCNSKNKKFEKMIKIIKEVAYVEKRD